jgi:NitT/TauT family transport system permease protein
MKRAMNIRPSRSLALVLGLLPFIFVAIFYVSASVTRHAANENDRLLPDMSQLAEGIQHIAFEADKRTGNIILWTDTAASLKRLAWGVGISASSGLLFGMLTGMFPLFRSSFAPPIAVLSLIPPMAILPILFVMCGLGEVSKVVLIALGIAPVIMRDMQGRVQDLPREQMIKAQSLGASSWQIALRVVLPQVLPRLLDALRLSLGAAWLFLISAEAIAAEDGLGYRIFLLRRYLAMDVILPYVAWITLLAWLMDRALRELHKKAFPWLRTTDAAEDAP